MASEDTEAKTLFQDVQWAPSIAVMFVCGSMFVRLVMHISYCLPFKLLEFIESAKSPKSTNQQGLKSIFLHHVLSCFVLEALTHTCNLPNSYSYASADAVIACHRVRRTKLLCRRVVERCQCIADSDLDNNSWSKWVGMQNPNTFTRLLWRIRATGWYRGWP